MALKITKQTLKAVVGWGISLGIAGLLGYWGYYSYAGKKVFDGKIDGKRVVYVLNSGMHPPDNNYDHDQLRIYGKNGKLQKILRDGGAYDDDGDQKYSRSRIDGKVNEISLFNVFGRETRIEPFRAIYSSGEIVLKEKDSPGERKDTFVDINGEKKTIDTLLNEATKEYESIIKEIEKKSLE